MTDQERQILFSLADTMSKTRDEIDAMRSILISVVNVLASNPTTQPVLVATLKAVIESDTAFSLGTVMTDAQIARREEWMKRLLPPHVLPALGL